MDSKHAYYFGIDLGTTNSCISLFKDGMHKTIMVEGRTTTPSCVMYSSRSEAPAVGVAAYENRHLTDKVVYSCKRDIQRCDEKIYHIDTRSEYEKENGIDADNPEKVFDVSPVEVSAEILRYLKKGAEKTLHMDGDVLQIRNVVITCPAYFVQSQREATLKAGKLAGFENVELIIEPTSAAVAYAGEGVKKEEVILIYDLGGGTFDLSALRVTPNSIIEEADFGVFTKFVHDAVAATEKSEESSSEFKGSEISVITTQGNSRLGGDDFDLALLDFVFSTIETEVNKVLKKPYFNSKIRFKDVIDEDTFEGMLCLTERAKKLITQKGTLSQPYSILLRDDVELGEVAEDTDVVSYVDGKTKVKVIVPFDPATVIDIFDERMFVKTRECMDRLFTECSSSNKAYLNRITKVVLIGGSTKFFGLKILLRDYIETVLPHLDVEICDSVNPDESVANGASVYSAASDNMAALAITDVISQHIGIKTNKEIDGEMHTDMFTQVIAKDSLVGIESHGSISVRTAEKDQTKVTIAVYEGDSITDSLYDKTYLGELVIDDIKPVPNSPHTSLTVYLDVGLDKLLHVRAKYNGFVDGKVQEIEEQAYIEYSHKDAGVVDKDKVEHDQEIKTLDESIAELKEQGKELSQIHADMYEKLKEFAYWKENRGEFVKLVLALSDPEYGSDDQYGATSMFGGREVGSTGFSSRRSRRR